MTNQIVFEDIEKIIIQYDYNDINVLIIKKSENDEDYTEGDEFIFEGVMTLFNMFFHKGGESSYRSFDNILYNTILTSTRYMLNHDASINIQTAANNNTDRVVDDVMFIRTQISELTEKVDDLMSNLDKEKSLLNSNSSLKNLYEQYYTLSLLLRDKI